MVGVQRDYLAEGGGGGGAGFLASASLTSTYLPSRSMAHFMYLIVKHRDLSEVTGQRGIPQETGGLSPPPPSAPPAGLQVHNTWPSAPAPSGKWESWSPDEEVSISARYGQLIAHLIKKRVVKIGRANGWLCKD